MAETLSDTGRFDVYVVVARENRRTGISFRTVSGTKTSTYSGSKLCVPIEALEVLLRSVRVEIPVQVSLLCHGWSITPEEKERLQAIKKHVLIEVDSDDTLFDALTREARAAAWGVTLNPNSIIAGPPITSNRVQSLHIAASNSGYSRGGMRFLLAQYGIISAKEVTNEVYVDVLRALKEPVLADLYNEKYRTTIENKAKTKTEHAAPVAAE